MPRAAIPGVRKSKKGLKIEEQGLKQTSTPLNVGTRSVSFKSFRDISAICNTSKEVKNPVLEAPSVHHWNSHDRSLNLHHKSSFPSKKFHKPRLDTPLKSLKRSGFSNSLSTYPLKLRFSGLCDPSKSGSERFPFEAIDVATVDKRHLGSNGGITKGISNSKHASKKRKTDSLEDNRVSEDSLICKNIQDCIKDLTCNETMCHHKNDLFLVSSQKKSVSRKDSVHKVKISDSISNTVCECESSVTTVSETALFCSSCEVESWRTASVSSITQSVIENSLHFGVLSDDCSSSENRDNLGRILYGKDTHLDENEILKNINSNCEETLPEVKVFDPIFNGEESDAEDIAEDRTTKLVEQKVYNVSDQLNEDKINFENSNNLRDDEGNKENESFSSESKLRKVRKQKNKNRVPLTCCVEKQISTFNAEGSGNRQIVKKAKKYKKASSVTKNGAKYSNFTKGILRRKRGNKPGKMTITPSQPFTSTPFGSPQSVVGKLPPVIEPVSPVRPAKKFSHKDDNCSLDDILLVKRKYQKTYAKSVKNGTKLEKETAKWESFLKKPSRRGSEDGEVDEPSALVNTSDAYFFKSPPAYSLDNIPVDDLLRKFVKVTECKASKQEKSRKREGKNKTLKSDETDIDGKWYETKEFKDIAIHLAEISNLSLIQE